MKAAIITTYGSPEVVHIKDIPTPIPKRDELLIRVHASAVNAADWRLRKADPWFVRLVFGPFSPARGILGVIFAGEVAQVGEAVVNFNPGDRLFGWTGTLRLGGHAEYVALPANGAFANMPDAMDFHTAAAIPFGYGTALNFLRKANVERDQQVLIHGASGAVGSAAVQLACTMGARVTGVCSTRNVDLVRALGADHVLDYHKDDLLAHRDRFDVVFETVGKLAYMDCLQLARPKGTVILGSEMPAQMLARLFFGQGGKRVKVVSGTVGGSAEEIKHLGRLWEQGAIKPVIDKVLPLERIREAHALAESGRKVGSVVIAIP